MSRKRQTTKRWDSNDGWEERGGYMNAKKQKLQQQFNEDAPVQLQKEGSGSKIFAGISIHVNGYTKPSSDELKRMMMLHGGNYEHYLYRTRVTHVIATNLPNSKVKELKGLKVVRPEWITESIAAGKLMSYTKYQLYTAQSGLQKGLHTFTTSLENSVQSEGSLQSNLDNNKSDVSIDTNSNGNSMNTANSTNSKNRLFYGETLDKDKSNDRFHNSVRIISPGKTADAKDPNFLSEFYSNSRLHYLSTWKAEWKNYVNELQLKGSNFPGREELRKIAQERVVTLDEPLFIKKSGKPQRCVMHIDMDCFFVSVGLRNRPDLRGKPVAVTHSKGKGQIPDPLADPALERRQWEEKKLQGRRKSKKIISTTDTSTIDDDTRFPDESDSDDDVTDDVINNVSSVTRTTTIESFHSMAEIASCSYEARQAGVKNGMFMGRAKSICPDLITIPYDFDGYKQVSKALYDTVARFTHDIEAVSCDEMLVDCTDLLADTGATPLEFATLLRSQLFKQTQCPASAGIGSSILLARIATRKAKPNGQFHLTEDLVADYIKSQPVKDLPGVGFSTTKRFEAMKVVTCDDLQRVSLDTLQKEFGPKTGQSLYRYCRGQDDRPIKMEQQRKSVSAEVNYGIRFDTESEAVKFMEDLSEEVCHRLKTIHMKGKTLTLKLMVRRQDAPKHTSKFMGHGICNNFSKSVTLPMATDDSRIVAKETISLLRSHKVDCSDLRGIGIQVNKLEPAEVGGSSNVKKIPSILNFAVKQNHASSSPNKTADKQSVAAGTVYRQKGNVETGLTAKESTLTAKGTELITKTKYSDCDNSDKIFTSKHELSSYKERENDTVKKFSSENMESEIIMMSEDEVLEPVLADTSVPISPDQDLLQDLVSRQRLDDSLPPLPCLPDIRTPDSGRKTRTCLTPEVVPNPPADVDYFPSPSQIDPAVLCELPDEIREQIEREVNQRREKPALRNMRTSQSTGAGCSNWQQESKNKTDNKYIEADLHSQDAIVALPSPSQIDLSCLEALPESLQAELRQAYARQDSKLTTKGGHTLQLKQAKSPAKSPNKRSPGKGSPHFKVPRGKPSGRGRKKGSSKKTLFKDQAKALQQQSTSYNSMPETLNRNGETTSSTNGFTDVASSSSNVQSKSDETLVNCFPDETEETEHTEVGYSTPETVCGVNLCGAVTLQDVRHLIKEWITSTPVPQEDDEEILKKYMVELVTDKNLEQVDLLLKYMLRNINRLKGADWLHTLERIFIHTQAAVFDLYGSQLVSINL